MWHDLRFGWRTLWRNPLLTFAALITLGLGVGGNTALFSVVFKTLLEPLPFPAPEHLIMIWETDSRRGMNQNVVAMANFLDWRSRATSVTGMAVAASQSATLNGEHPEVVPSLRVSPEWLTTLGVNPILGRSFIEADSKPGAPAVIVLGESLWRRKFGGDTRIIGKSIQVDDTPHQVIGVINEPFAGLNHKAEVWQAQRIDPARDYRQSGRSFRVIARLRDGVTISQAQAELNGIAMRLQQEHPKFNAGWGASAVPLSEQFAAPLRGSLWIIFGAGLAVLLIACVNVANLLLARSAGRRRELAVRASLGAGRARLVRQLLVESVLLGTLGGLFGLLVAIWAIDGLKTLLPPATPRLETIHLQMEVVLFALAMALATGLLAGAGPAVLHAGANLTGGMREGAAGSGSGKSGRRLRNALVILETALTVVLLAGAVVFTQSLLNLRAVPAGFDPKNVLTLNVSTGGEQYRQPAAQLAYFEEAVRRAARVPGVESASAITFLPFSGPGSATSYRVTGLPEPEAGTAPVTDVRIILSGYMDTMRIPLRAGRFFQSEDFRLGGPARLLVNETLARQSFPGENPIGRSLNVAIGNSNPGEIVGVVADTRHSSLTAPVRPMVYYPYTQLAFGFMTLVVRARGDVQVIQAPVEAAVRTVDPARPVTNVRTMETYLERTLQQNRAQSWLLGSFSGLALLLTVVGVGGVLMLTVSQSVRELGIRLALGAQPVSLLTQVVGQGLALVATGIAIGVAGALALAAQVQTQIHGVSSRDPGTIAAVAVTLLAAGALAALFPAWRATRVDPAVVLRQD
ncbi:MAG: ABC transporter permease [Acidobacteria bacterium]|nr:ABC transporter permease [Acidobacteriota bacterium]